MNIFPTSLQKAKSFIDLNSFDLIISIFNPKFKNTDLDCNPSKRIIVHFEDTEHPDDIEFMEMKLSIEKF